MLLQNSGFFHILQWFISSIIHLITYWGFFAIIYIYAQSGLSLMLRNLLVLQRGRLNSCGKRVQSRNWRKAVPPWQLQLHQSLQLLRIRKNLSVGTKGVSLTSNADTKRSCTFLMCLFSRKCSAHDDKPVAFELRTSPKDASSHNL